MYLVARVNFLLNEYDDDDDDDDDEDDDAVKRTDLRKLFSINTSAEFIPMIM